jgi:hypothetical protein
MYQSRAVCWAVDGVVNDGCLLAITQSSFPSWLFEHSGAISLCACLHELMSSCCTTWPEMTDIVQAYKSVSGFSVYTQEFIIILLRPIKASGISNIRVGGVYKVKHEVCPQVVAFRLPGSGCSLSNDYGNEKRNFRRVFLYQTCSKAINISRLPSEWNITFRPRNNIMICILTNGLRISKLKSRAFIGCNREARLYYSSK